MIFLWKKYKFLQYVPESLIQAEAGNKPFRPLRPPIQGLSKIFEEWLLWKGSSQAGFEPLTETHLKQSIPAAEKKEINNSFLMSQDFLKKGEVFFCQPDITKQRDTSCCFLGPKKKVQKTSKHNYWFFLSLLLPDTLLCEDFRCSRQEVNKARDAALFSL